MLIDRKPNGQKIMQAVGLIMSFVLFIIAAGSYQLIDVKGPGAKVYEFIYFFSSFWIQFDPNPTTFPLAAEVYPAPVRTTVCGLSAVVEKLRALIATVIYNYISPHTEFWVIS